MTSHAQEGPFPESDQRVPTLLKAVTYADQVKLLTTPLLHLKTKACLPSQAPPSHVYGKDLQYSAPLMYVNGVAKI